MDQSSEEPDVNPVENFEENRREAGRLRKRAVEKGVTPQEARKKRRLQRAVLTDAEYVHGNYASYYSRRSLETDHRVAAMSLRKTIFAPQPTWLDIGCNTGQLSNAIASAVSASRLVGIDIDKSLTDRATAALPNAFEKDADFFPLSVLGLNGEDKEGKRSTEFKAVNIVNSKEEVPCARGGECGVCGAERIPGIPVGVCQYDVVSLFSVAKWVHLHYGDSGIQYAFCRIHSLLKVGGYFVFEPQTWKSYRKAIQRITTAEFKKRDIEIKMNPKDFDPFLKGLGFTLLEDMLSDSTERCSGEFGKRSLLLYRKDR